MQPRFHNFTKLASSNSKKGDAISQLNEAGFTNDISVLAKNWNHKEAHTYTVKVGSEGTKAGALAGE